MALAEDHAHIESEKWRRVALQAVYVCVAAFGFSLLAFIPPHFDLGIGTIAAVLFITGFLAYTERPTQAAGMSVAPLTAVIAASTVVFGYWSLLIVVVALGAVRMRVPSEMPPVRQLFSPASLCQTSAGIIAVYCMVAVWGIAQSVQSRLPHWGWTLVVLVAVVVIGMVWQAVQNGLLYVAHAILGRHANMTQFLRVGVIASLYAYLLIGLYVFGGLLAAALFYVLVARTRVVEDIVGVTRNLNLLEHARGQAEMLISELLRFTDRPNVQFTGEVKNIAQMMARHMGLPRKDVASIGKAAELHEIGKCRLPVALRRGRGATPAEEAQRRTYSRLGALMLRAADALVTGEVADYIEFHTERFDGTGYPKRLAGDAIPLPSRIIAVARAYVCSLTGYDDIPKLEKEEALRLLREQAGTLYDPRLVDLLGDLVT